MGDVKRLDVRGKFCPLPVLETAKAINDVPIGGVLEVLATDPAAEPDLIAWAKSTGNEVVAAEKAGGVVKVSIRRVK